MDRAAEGPRRRDSRSTRGRLDGSRVFRGGRAPGLPVRAGAARVQLAYASLEHGFRGPRAARGSRAAGDGLGGVRVHGRATGREVAAEGEARDPRRTVAAGYCTAGISPARSWRLARGLGSATDVIPRSAR